MHTFLRIAAAALLLPAAAFANPAVNITWTTCPAGNPPTNRTLADGPTATVVVTGHGFTQSVRGIEIKVRVGRDWIAGLPDSWRYDAAGCSASGFQASYASAGCPSIVGTNPVSAGKFEYDGVWGMATLAFIFDAWTPNPGTTYTLAQFTFDKSNGFRGLGAKADSCGCAEKPECLRIASALWVDTNISEQVFILESGAVSWEDPSGICSSISDCFEPPCFSPDPCSLPQQTPVAQRSWGSLKASYR
jgi:hypothetical protein